MSFYALNHNSGRQIKLLILPQTLQIQINPIRPIWNPIVFISLSVFLSVPNSFCQLPFSGGIVLFRPWYIRDYRYPIAP